MSYINVLDCTLRDGGYVNNWEFGRSAIERFLLNINLSKIDYVEVGFLKKENYTQNRTVFNDIKLLNNIIPNKFQPKVVAMADYSKFGKSDIIVKNDKIKLDAIRVMFKEKDLGEVYEFMRTVTNSGYELFVNPTNIETFSNKSLVELIKNLNDILPKAFTIVDTNGVLGEDDLLRLYDLIDNNLDNTISIGFHSHNSLQLSFANAQCLIKNAKERHLIIDASIHGMGRGAGNLCTELLIKYLNDNYNKEYNTDSILEILDEVILPIYKTNPWGYSIPYYLAGINHCHPNYAKYLLEHNITSTREISHIFANIPDDKKPFFNEEIIKQLI